MRLDRRGRAPARDDQVDPAPERHLSIMILCNVIEQSHPKSGECLVIEIDQMVVRGELEKLFAHASECRGQRQLVQITQRHRDMGGVSKLRRRNGRRLKRLDKNCDFGVARKLSRLQFKNLAARIHFLPNEKKEHRANDRHDETRPVERSSWLRFREQTSDQAADD